MQSQNKKVKPSRLERAQDLMATLNANPSWTRADLARHLGVSRATITKALSPLKESNLEIS